jgi:formylglycine-generating enzyme required for sulfatase activity
MKPTANNSGNVPSGSLLVLSLVLVISAALRDSALAREGEVPAETPAQSSLTKAAESRKGWPAPRIRNFDFESLRLAIEDLTLTFGENYSKGREHLEQLARLEKSSNAVSGLAEQNADPAKTNVLNLARELEKLRYDALLSNPLLDFDGLLVLKRKRGQLGLPVNHKCNSGIERTGYDNEIAVLSPVRPDGALRTLYRPAATEFVGEMDLHFDAEKLLFTMPKGPTWQIFEVGTDGGGLRQVTRGQDSDVDNFDGCYLPDGRIVFASTASYHAVPCWHGKERACSLYLMNADGGGVRQLCFDQDLDLHPSVLPTGQVIFSRWDYAGPMHIYLRPLMVMNPDGTGQRAVYGSNSYWPNALYFPRGIPDAPNKLIAIIAGYHGVPRMGELGLIDISRGWHEADGVVQRIPGRGKPVKPIIRDNLVDNSWPKFLHPYPLSEKYFLVSCRPSAKSPWGIYLVDVFDNMLAILVDSRFDFFEPIPLRKTPRPPAVPDRVDLDRSDAVVYLHDVYAGPGLSGVPRGAVKRLRIVAYHFGYPGLAGPDKIGCGGPWEAMWIIGTVPVHKDGSAMFRAPANTPLCVQPLDEEGKAIQLMRSWFTAMPGEVVSCVGCHEQPNQVPPARYALAANRPPDDIEPWYGPPRGFDFEREVQPVLDKYCVGCHSPSSPNRPAKPQIADLRSERYAQNYRGRELTKLGADRLHPDVKKALGGTAVRYTPAYEALIPYIRRVNIEDDVGLLVPGEYHADTSELIQMLKKGHYNVQPDKEGWDRIVTWIDLNGPCHGAWREVCPIPDNAAQRRRELQHRYGGPSEDPEKPVQTARRPVEPIMPEPMPKHEQQPARLAGWPFDPDQARRRQEAAGLFERTVDLGGGVTMRVVRIPAGRFVMGDPNGEPDERPAAAVSIPRDFWMGTREVTNEQYRRFDPDHEPGYFTKRFQGPDGPGLSLAGEKQPVVRVSWNQAMVFCRWLSQKTGEHFTLPTEAQWEYACRAGSQSALYYGDVEADFSAWANVADKALSVRPGPTGGLETNLTAHFGKGILASAVYGSSILCDPRFDDGAVATANTAGYRPNAWGLYDMHGNAAEWTRTAYRPYFYEPADDHNSPNAEGAKVVRGGAWCDRPARCRSAFRLSYPAWQRVYNVGFRVVCSEPGSDTPARPGGLVEGSKIPNSKY